MQGRWLITLALCLLLCVPSLDAQSTAAQIVGRVFDSSGAVIPEAQVSAFNEGTGIRYQSKSNQSGEYIVALLPAGKYRMTVQKEGFQPTSYTDIQLAARDVRRIDVTMQVGKMQTAVEVSGGGATLIETDTGRISSTKSADTLKTLPLNTRSMYSFLQLTPGVLVMTGGTSYMRFGGSRNNQENEAVDGITFNNLYDGTLLPQGEFIEGFQEMRVDMANNSAEFGSLGQVTMITKQGNNEPHGSLYEYYSPAGLTSRNPFAATRDSYVRHSLGGSVGGPILIPKLYNGRNKSFFFFTLETMRGGAIGQLLTATVPTSAWRNGDFSGLLPGTVVKDPSNSLTPFPSNQIPANRLNSVSQKMQNMFYPLPNYGDTSVFQSSNFRQVMRRPYDPYTQWMPRLDHRLSDKSYLYGRFTWMRFHNNPYQAMPTLGQRYQQRDNRGFSMAYSYTFRPTLLNEFRWGLARNNNPRWPKDLMGKQIVDQLGLVGLADNLPDIPGVPKVNWSGLGLTSVNVDYDYRNPGFANRVYQFQDHVSWFHGRHNVKVGAAVTRVTFLDGLANGATFGNFTFSNRFTGQPYADFLLGIPTTTQRAFPYLVQVLHRWTYEGFVTDDFKVNSKLTLNLGLRYEVKPPWGEENGLLSAFDIGTGKIVVPDGSASKTSTLLPRSYVDVLEAGKAGYPSNLIRTDRNNFAPRIGIAYRPFGASTVLRAAYGIFYDVVPAIPTAAGVPYLINEPSYTNPTTSPDVVFPRAFPATSVGGPSTVSLPSAIRTDLRIPYSMQYNFTIEHQRWDTGFRISYIGTNTRQGEWAYNINQPLPSTQAYVNKPRMFPNYSGFNYITNGGGHQYNSLTLAARRDLAKGLTYQLSYELARDIGDLEREGAPENAYDRKRERGVNLDVPTHRVVGNFVYQLPFGKGQRFLTSSGRLLNALAGGWAITGAYSMYSGQFLTPYWSGSDPVGTAYTGSTTPALVTIRPNEISNPNLPSDQRSIYHWFNAGAFTAPTAGAFGTSARGVIIGPGINVLHTGLAKYFTVMERLKVRCEATATNVANHPNWSNPGTTITSTSSVGVITGVGGIASYDQSGPRTLRLGLRAEW
jgi:hypothetical protein